MIRRFFEASRVREWVSKSPSAETGIDGDGTWLNSFVAAAIGESTPPFFWKARRV
jgi:hypothetical protein